MIPSPSRVGWVGLGASLFVFAQISAATTVWALPMLVAFVLVATWRDALDLSVPPTRVEWAALLCGAVWLVCAWLGADPQRSVRLSVPMLVFLILLAGLGRARRGDHAAPALAVSLSVVATVWSIQVAFLAATGTRQPEDIVARLGVDWIVVPNDFAYAALLWPVWLQRWTGRAPWQRGLIALALGAQGLAFVLVESRLAVLLALMGLTLMLVHGYSHTARRHQTALFAAALMLLAGAALLLLVPALADKGVQSLSARFELWQAAWNLFVDAPLTGIGPHNFVLLHADVMASPTLRADPRLTPWPHSLPLELLAETGLLGCAATALLLACAAFRRPVWRMHVQRVHALSALGTAIPALTLCLLEASTLRVWLWMLAAWWLGRANRRQLAYRCPEKQETTAPD